MKKVLTGLAGTIVLFQLGAVTPEEVEAYTDFKDAETQLALLAADRDSSWGIEEIKALIDEWQDAGVREHVVKSLAGNGLDLAKSESALVVEWGGGGIPYCALYIAEKVFLAKEQDKKLAVNELTLNDDIKTAAVELRNLLIEDQYSGMVAGAGTDIITCIITAFEPDGSKTAIVYDAATEKTPDDTVAVLKAIAALKKSCNIDCGSGA